MDFNYAFWENQGERMTNPETNYLQLGQSAGLFLLGIFSAWSIWRQKKTGKTVDSIHTLSNSAMSAQLTLNVNFAKAIAVQARRIADDSKQQGDIAAATAADVVVASQQKLLDEHLLAQAKVDAKSP